MNESSNTVSHIRSVNTIGQNLASLTTYIYPSTMVALKKFILLVEQFLFPAAYSQEMVEPFKNRMDF